MEICGIDVENIKTNIPCFIVFNDYQYEVFTDIDLAKKYVEYHREEGESFRIIYLETPCLSDYTEQNDEISYDCKANTESNPLYQVIVLRKYNTNNLISEIENFFSLCSPTYFKQVNIEHSEKDEICLLVKHKDCEKISEKLISNGFDVFNHGNPIFIYECLNCSGSGTIDCYGPTHWCNACRGSGYAS